MWKRHVQEQIVDQPAKIRAAESDLYEQRKLCIERKALTMDRNNLMTFEISHWRGLPKHLHLQRMDEIATKTCMAKILAQKPVLRWSDRIPNSYIEYWTVYGQPRERFDSWLTKYNFKGTYSLCAQHLGYDAEL